MKVPCEMRRYGIGKSRRALLQFRLGWGPGPSLDWARGMALRKSMSAGY